MPNTSRRFTPGNVDALNTLLDSASERLATQRQTSSRTGQPGRSGAAPLTSILGSENTGILFTGNPHEAVPRRLLLDNRLTPLERNAWQVFRLLLNDDGLTSFPTYEQLQPYLASSPFKVASRETVAKALTTLRLTRWLSLAGQVRDEKTGQMKGNIYLLHDEPVSIPEAMLLDRNYLELLGNAQQHANKSIREVAAHTLEELSQDPHVRHHTVPTRLDVLQQRMARQSWATAKPEGVTAHESELSKHQSELSEKPPVRNGASHSSEPERSRKQGTSSSVRNPNSSSTCTNTNTDVCKNVVPRAHASQDDGYPSPFLELPTDQRLMAIQALIPLPEQLRQDVLSQWASKPHSSLRNPFGYLLGMIDKARNGEFNQRPRQLPDRPAPMPATTPAPAVRAEAPVHQPHCPSEESRALAKQKMTEMMQMVRGRPSREAVSPVAEYAVDGGEVDSSGIT
jgi:hypothetical protein